MANNKPICVDLFAGAGGFSLAALAAGFEIRFAVEMERHAASTYRYNISQKHDVFLYEECIEKLDADRISKHLFDESENCDLVLGGPPCQGFSTHRLKNSGVSDPRNSLIHSYFSFVRAIKPKMFLMENVPGLLWERHKEGLKAFYKEADKAGYVVNEPIVLDARDFGIPQRRKRVFILGCIDNRIKSKIWPPHATHEDKNRKNINKDLKPWKPSKIVFEKKVPKTDPNAIHMQHSDAIKKVLASTPINGGSRKDSIRTLPCHKNHDGHKDVYGRINPFEPAPTMTGSCINPSKGRFVHPVKNRGISVREAARIQTFPDDFNFNGGLIAGGVQVGNAVPVEMGRILLNSLHSLLK